MTEGGIERERTLEICKGLQQSPDYHMLVMKTARLGNEPGKRIRKKCRVHMGLGIVPVIKFLDLYLLIVLTENMRCLY